MSKQTPVPGRRAFLKGAAVSVPIVVGVGVQCPTGAAEATKSDSAEQRNAPWKAADYSPNYFTDAEWAFLLAAIDRLIPADATGPGAIEAGVPEFFDRQMDTDYGWGLRWYMQGPFHPEAEFSLGYQMQFNPRDLYRAGIKEVDDWCNKQHNNTFAKLPGDQQDAVLRQLESGSVQLPTVLSKEFFIQLLTNTKEGYFADPMYGGNKNMGPWKMIGFPGARADFADWSKQPNKKYPLPPVSIMGQKG